MIQLDRRRLESIGPTSIAGYLRNRGWKRTGNVDGLASVWTREDHELLLPMRQDLGDYALRVSEAFSALEAVEHRPRTEIVQDVLVASADVVTLRLTGPNLQDGNIPLLRSGEVLSRAKELMAVAACAAVSPKPVFGSKRPDEATGWLGHLRLAPPEAGSFVLRIISETTAALETQGTLILDEEPFERRAVVSVLRGVDAARSAAAEAGATGGLAPFESAVSKGVSANLCEAVADVIEAAQAAALDLGVSWASNRHAPPGVPDRVLVGSDAVPVLRGAGRGLRERAPDEDYELAGWVVSCSRAVPEERGEVTVQAQVGGAWRRVRMELEGPAYNAAVEAHGSKSPVRCRGTLVKEGRGFVLKQARSFEVESVDGSP